MEDGLSFPELTLIASILIGLAMFVKSGLRSLGLPPLVGFLVLGFVLRLVDEQAGLLTEDGEAVFQFLGQVGLIFLLFRVGLESDVRGLLKHLREAVIVAFFNVAASGLAGFAAAYWLLNLDLIQSLFAGTALTATSVGLIIPIWQRAKALRTRDGEVLLDVAELDDISGVVLMILLFGVASALREPGASGAGRVLLQEGSWTLFKLLVFGGLCFLFSQYLEPRVTEFARRTEDPPDPMITLVAIGMLTGAVAGVLGFSLAIGAFFGGLVFSRDPQARKIDVPFSALYGLFVPWFFIELGFHVAPQSLMSGLAVGGVLLMAAVMGKVLGGGLPAVPMLGWRSAGLIGVSLVPRAEICMVVMRHGRARGAWAVPDRVYSGTVVVVALTCMVVPLFLTWLLRRWGPQRDTE